MCDSGLAVEGRVRDEWGLQEKGSPLVLVAPLVSRGRLRGTVLCLLTCRRAGGAQARYEAALARYEAEAAAQIATLASELEQLPPRPEDQDTSAAAAMTMREVAMLGGQLQAVLQRGVRERAAGRIQRHVRARWAAAARLQQRLDHQRQLMLAEAAAAASCMQQRETSPIPVIGSLWRSSGH